MSGLSLVAWRPSLRFRTIVHPCLISYSVPNRIDHALQISSLTIPCGFIVEYVSLFSFIVVRMQCVLESGKGNR